MATLNINSWMNLEEEITIVKPTAKRRVKQTVTEVKEVKPILSVKDTLTNWIKEQTHPGSYSFNIAVENDGVVSYHPRIHQPCWGELRTHYNDIDKPNDLYNPFPEGTPVGIAIWTRDRDQELLAWQLSAESPWRNGVRGATPVLKDNIGKGFILEDMSIDPTALGSMLLNLKGGNHLNAWKKLQADKVNPAVAYWVAYSTQCYGDNYDWNAEGIDYYIVKKLNPKRFFNGDNRQITIDANTFAERGAYNRKEVHNLFTDAESVSVRSLYGKKYPKLDYPTILKIARDIESKYL